MPLGVRWVRHARGTEAVWHHGRWRHLGSMGSGPKGLFSFSKPRLIPRRRCKEEEEGGLSTVYLERRWVGCTMLDGMHDGRRHAPACTVPDGMHRHAPYPTACTVPEPVASQAYSRLR